MDNETIELIALGASAAVNCRPCMEFHLAEGRNLGIPDGRLREALDVGLKVSQGARKKTASYIEELLSSCVGEEQNACCV